MKIIIIEDEFPAQQRLKKLIKDTIENAEILVILDSISSSLRWLEDNSDYDLIICDIQLADGISLRIFEQIDVKKPIIFTTAYDEYALSTFKYFSLDYLLKPISKADFERAVQKFNSIKNNQNSLNAEKIINLIQSKPQNYKTRFLVSVGNKSYPINIKNISMFYIKNQATYIFTDEQNSYMIDIALDEIEKSLNPDLFFRINRQIIISINAISSFENYINGRLIIKTNSKFSEDVIVSKRKAGAFKLWMG